MAMNNIILGNAIADTLMSPDTPTEQKEDIRELWRDIADVIIKHIQTNAQVNVVSVSGVTTGPGISGPGTGTIV